MTFGGRVLKLHPTTLVMTSFLLVITTGTLILKLPISTTGGQIEWIDAFFTATSAVCVTGLTVLDTGHYFSTFGLWVILALIQVGGLGLMTISVALFQWIGRSVSFRQRMAMQDLFSHTPREDIFSLVRSVIFFTVAAEGIGAFFLTLFWMNEFELPKAIFTAVFHSVSAFCNAGFSLFADNFMRYSDSFTVNAVICVLIVVGGIGFPVLYDLQSFLSRRNKRKRLLIQTKTVLLTTLILIIVGAVMFILLERQSTSAYYTWSHRVMVALFQSITCRTAGFNSVDIAALREATLAMMIFLMFFGASPGSCGGGVKTTTLALLTAFTISRVRRKRRVNLFKKSIPLETLARSVSLIVVSMGVITLVFFLLLAGEPATGSKIATARGSFLKYLFETVSAFGTVGLSMGVTPHLSPWGKIWICLMMIIGRVGVLTFSYIIVGADTANGVEYSEENLMIG